jgi:predicted dienelactone hydrolase
MFRKLFCAASVAALVACASQPQKAQTPATTTSTGTASKTTLAHYLPDETTYPVGSIPNAVLHDSARNKDLVMTIEYPTRGGPYPVIVFSHGFGGSNVGYTPLTEYWAGHGYIVIKPSHADSGKLGPILEQRREQRRAEMEKARAEGRGRNGRNAQPAAQQGQTAQQPDSLAEAIWSTQTASDWENRARDIELIIDNLSNLEKKYPELGGRMDTSKVAVSGHSYGAFTAMMVSGMTSFATNPPLHIADPRVKAAVVFSPQGTTNTLGLTKDSWKDVTIPMMFITGSLDYFTAGDAKPRHDAFAYSPAGDKLFLSFNGARHMTFAGGTLSDISDDEIPVRMLNGGGYYPGSDPMNPQPQMATRGTGGRGGSSLYQRDRRIFTAAKIASTAFFDAYLKNDTAAKDYLKPGGTLESFNGGEVTIERK